MILADDLGYGDVHCLNPKRGKIPTPNIDRLATEGMIFTDAHSGSSVCTPTRYGILTGRYAWRTRLQSGVMQDHQRPLIAPDRLTVAGWLKQHGYHTAVIGKWHLGYRYEGITNTPKSSQRPTQWPPVGTQFRDGPVSRGFDSFFGFHHAGSMHTLAENDRVIAKIKPVEMLPRLTQRAVAYIDERAAANQPFFLYLPLNSPHTPIVPTQEWRGKSGLGDYADFVMQTDAAVGEVVTALDKAGLAGKTLILFASDNGCAREAGVENLENRGHYPSARSRGYKTDIWEGGHRVPFIARWPGVVKPGTQSGQLVCLGDLLATSAEILGVKLPASAAEDSFSFLPLLKGSDKPMRGSLVHHSVRGQFAIREGKWKLLLCPGSGGASKPNDALAAQQQLPAVQLYDMSRDEGEQKNLQGEHPEIVARLRVALEKIIAGGRSTPGPTQKNDVPVDIFKKGK